MMYFNNLIMCQYIDSVNYYIIYNTIISSKAISRPFINFKLLF